MDNVNDKSIDKIGFIGAGKVGFSLGRFFAEHGIRVTGYYSRHTESARQAAEFTGSKVFEGTKELIENSKVIFLTVPDGEIKSVFDNIKIFDIADKQICHCSGALTASQAFDGIESSGAYGYSIHPLFPVSSKEYSYRELPDAFFCLEGDGPHLNLWQKKLEGICGGVKIIAGDNKVKYHGACAIASNLYCGLVSLSVQMLGDCGFDENQAIKALAPLMKSNLEHILEDGPVKALTGPVERGDITTVEKHIDCFESEDDRQLYKSVTKKLIEIGKLKNPAKDYKAFDQIYNKED